MAAPLAFPLTVGRKIPGTSRNGEEWTPAFLCDRAHDWPRVVTWGQGGCPPFSMAQIWVIIGFLYTLPPWLNGAVKEERIRLLCAAGREVAELQRANLIKLRYF